jgi:hypothetical protein
VNLTVAAGAAVNSYGGYSLASTSTDNVITFDPLPRITINQASTQADPTTISPVLFDIVWSEPVSWFDANDFDFEGTAQIGPRTLTGGGLLYQLSVPVLSTGYFDTRHSIYMILLELMADCAMLVRSFQS